MLSSLLGCAIGFSLFGGIEWLLRLVYSHDFYHRSVESTVNWNDDLREWPDISDLENPHHVGMWDLRVTRRENPHHFGCLRLDHREKQAGGVAEEGAHVEAEGELDLLPRVRQDVMR